MTPHRTIVVLTDGEMEIARSIDELRRRGFRLLATSRPYEAVRWVLKTRADLFLARNELLPEGGSRFLAELRALSGGVRIVIVTSGAETSHEEWPAHTWLERTGPAARIVERLTTLLDTPMPDPADGDGASAPIRASRGGPAWSRAAVPDGFTGRLGRICDVVTACRMMSEAEDDLDTLVPRALEFFADLTASQRTSIMMRCRETSKLKLVGKTGFPAEVRDPIEVAVGEGIAGRVLAAEKPMLVPDAATASLTSPRAGYSGASFLVVPILHRQSAVGVVNLTNRNAPGPYTEEELIYAMMLADQFASNYANAVCIAELRTMTVIDPLTLLYNRRHFDNELKREVERARRYGRELTLALMDIDHFKRLNDQCGYSVADDVLRMVAGIIKQNFREVDIVTRWGGDEFAVILPETGEVGTLELGRLGPRSCIERVRQVIERTDVRALVPESIPCVTVSIGVATFPASCANDAELFERATAALQDAKRRGNNRTSFAE